MKKTTIILYVLILIILGILGTDMTFQAMTNKNIREVLGVTQKELKKTVKVNSAKCSDKPPLLKLDSAKDLRIKKLNEYQIVCKSLAAKRLMIFTDMPNSNTTAVSDAKKMAETLREFHKYSITPVVIVEPVTKWGLIDFLEFNTGFYNTWINTYFNTLQKEGITDMQMGIWVPFPEANIPTWNKVNSKPKDFAIGVNTYLTILKKYYPEARGSILLNSATYDNNDYEWAYGEYVSLIPYIEHIDKNLVDSFGLQGFPWLPGRNSPSDGLTDPSQYLRYLLAVEAAEKLQVKEIWFNTGTFTGKYMMDPIKKVTVDAPFRKLILDNTITEIRKAQERGFKIWVNIFAEDKSITSEQTDWSYWHDVKDTMTPDKIIFKDFLFELNQNKIEISLYDSYKEQGVTVPSVSPQVIHLKRTPTPRPTHTPRIIDQENE